MRRFNFGTELGFKEEGLNLLRGLAGGLLFGIPILYTTEVWQHGVSYHSSHLLGIFLLTFSLNVIFCSFAGVRKRSPKERLFSSLGDGLTSMTLGLALALVVMFLIGRIRPEEDLRSSLGKILLEACIISMGVTFTNFKFGSKSDFDERTRGDKKDPYKHTSLSEEQKQIRADLNDLAVTFGGAFIFTFNVAPTDEVVAIATDSTSASLLVLLLAEFIFCYLILYASGFKRHIVYRPSLLQTPLAETFMNVSGSLLVSAVLLGFVGDPAALANPASFMSCVVVLGLPASVGASAGRLVI
jgi:putative integral membrane protein (TIGR02587 family)